MIAGHVHMLSRSGAAWSAGDPPEAQRIPGTGDTVRGGESGAGRSVVARRDLGGKA